MTEKQILRSIREASSYEEAKKILENSEQTESLCAAALKINGTYLSAIKNKSPKLCAIAFENAPVAIIHIPKELRTEEMWISAVKKEAFIFSHCKGDEQTNALSLLAVKRNGNYLKDIKNLTYEICFAAVGSNGFSLKYVPNKFRDDNLLKRAVNQEPLALEHVKKQSKEICFMAIKKNANALKFVQHQTPEMCSLAIEMTGEALQHVKKQTDELCLAAVSRKGSTLIYVQNQTANICLTALNRSKKALPFVKIVPKGTFEETVKNLSILLFKDKISALD